jgi:hypothetical protein
MEHHVITTKDIIIVSSRSIIVEFYRDTTEIAAAPTAHQPSRINNHPSLSLFFHSFEIRICIEYITIYIGGDF